MNESLSWSAEDGALTQFFLAASPLVKDSGKYYHPVAEEVQMSSIATGASGDKLAKDLWEFSEFLVQEKTRQG